MSLASKLSDINGTLSIIEGNQREFLDADCHTGWLQSYGRMYLFTGSQKHPFKSEGMKWKLNAIDATELCKNKKNYLPMWFVGKKGIGIILLIATVKLVFSSDMC